MHRNLVAVVIRCEDLVFYGKHAEGPYQGKWGFASVDSHIESRPKQAARRLAETSTLGLLDNYTMKKTTTPLGIKVFIVETANSELAAQLERVSRFNRSCFPIGSCPPGLAPWSHTKFSDEKITDVDLYTREIQQFLFPNGEAH